MPSTVEQISFPLTPYQELVKRQRGVRHYVVNILIADERLIGVVFSRTGLRQNRNVCKQFQHARVESVGWCFCIEVVRTDG